MKVYEAEQKLEAFQWELIKQEYSKATWKKYVKDIQKMLRYMGKQDICKSTLKDYKQYLMKNYKPNTVNSYLISGNVFMKWLGRNDLILKTIRIQKKTSMEKVISRQEYEKIAQELKQQKSWRNYMILKVLAMTGMRVGELRYITTEVLETGKVTVMKKGKYREVYLQESLVEMLKEYCRKEKIETGYLFFGKNKDIPLDTTAVWKMLKKAAEKAGVEPDKVYPHSFRHLFAKTYMQQIGNILELADILGHSSVETTRMYTLTSSEEKRRTLEQLKL